MSRAILAYAAVIRIQTASQTRQEADETARVASVVQAHLRCDCPSPNVEPPTPKRLIPIEDRRVT